MLFFYLVALPLVACAVVAALLWLPSKSTGWLVRADVGLAWFAALATLILVPTDVATTLQQSHPGYLSTWWLASYWYGFVVQVLVLPIHMEFTRSGEFTIWDRVLQSVRSNLIYYGLLAGIGLAGILLLLFKELLKPSNVLGFCIAFSNAYGLIAGIFLLGYGLVAVPKQLWKCADLHGERRRLEHQAGLQAERAQEAHRRLSVAVLTARKASVLFANHDPMRPYMDTVLALANSVGPSFRPTPGAEVPDESEMDYFDKHDLAGLRRAVKACLKDYEREKALYVKAVQAYLGIEEVLERLDSGQTVPADAAWRERLLWVWRCHLHYWVFRLAAVLAAACSLSIVVAESTISGKLPNTSLVSWALHRASGQQFATELLCLLCLAYPCACAYYAIYRLGQFSFYRLVPRHTDAYSLCYSALLMCRFGPPLAFNFMAAIAMPVDKSAGSVPDVTNTVFYSTAHLGELMMRQPLIGWQFTTFAPAALAPYMLLLLLGFFDPLIRTLSRLFRRSVKLTFEDDWETSSGATSAGRRLLRMERENYRNGLPLGLTIEPSAGDGLMEHRGLLGGIGPEPASEPPAPWWRRMLGRGGGTASEAGPSRPKHSEEAVEARGRLSRALGRGGGMGGASGDSGYSDEVGTARGGYSAATAGRGGGAGAGVGAPPGPRAVAPAEDRASPTRRLLTSDGSESEPPYGKRGTYQRSDVGGADIFSRIEGDGRERHGWRSTLGAGPPVSGTHSPIHSVDVESVESAEDGQSRMKWLRKFARNKG